jgi:diadenosine tetraphosphate (Ap4A) HIT family hydrolase
VLAESPATWVASWERVACRGYACIFAKRHVVEPYELDAAERAAFFSDVVAVARAVEALFRPVKLNYEIHGNTIPHLHLNLFPRYVGDPFGGGATLGAESHASHTPEDLDRMATAFTIALRASGGHA